MPLYQFKCNLCDKQEEKYIYVQNKNFKKEMTKNAPFCDCSGKPKKMSQQFTVPDVIVKKLTVGDLMDDPSRKRPMEFFDTKKQAEEKRKKQEEKFGPKKRKGKKRTFYVE